jgi:succinate dehydrogenase assembly factor 2
MPLSPEHVTPERSPPDAAPRDQDIDLSDPNLPFPEPLARDGESIDQLRARLVYQTRKRGTLESDLLMSTFAKQHMSSMSEAELKEFDKVRFAYP